MVRMLLTTLAAVVVILAFAAFGAFIPYAFGAFVAADWDIHNWTEMGRVVIGCMSVFGGFAMGVLGLYMTAAYADAFL